MIHHYFPFLVHFGVINRCAQSERHRFHSHTYGFHQGEQTVGDGFFSQYTVQ